MVLSQIILALIPVANKRDIKSWKWQKLIVHLWYLRISACCRLACSSLMSKSCGLLRAELTLFIPPISPFSIKCSYVCFSFIEPLRTLLLIDLVLIIARRELVDIQWIKRNENCKRRWYKEQKSKNVWRISKFVQWFNSRKNNKMTNFLNCTIFKFMRKFD